MSTPTGPGQDGEFPLPPEGAMPTAGPNSPPLPAPAPPLAEPPPASQPAAPPPRSHAPPASAAPPAAPKSNTTPLVVVIALLAIVIAAGVTLYLTGALGGGSQSGSSSSNADSASGEILLLTPANIAGSWASNDCADPTVYRADGTWGGVRTARVGTYTINNDQLVLLTDGLPGASAYRIERLTRASFSETNLRSGETRTRNRCAEPAASNSGPSGAGGDLPSRLQQAVAEFQPRLPLRNGPVTISIVGAVDMTLIMTLQIAGDMDASQWARIDDSLRANICSGPFGSLIRSGASASLVMQDSPGEAHSLWIRGC